MGHFVKQNPVAPEVFRKFRNLVLASQPRWTLEFIKISQREGID